ncbi:MAG: excinuclease ABC subunit B, partial [Chthoniobacterales bacterium]
DYKNMLLPLRTGEEMSREKFLGRLVDLLYERNDIAFGRGKFRVRGDVVEVHPANMDETAVRVEFFGDNIDRISIVDPLTGHVTESVPGLTIFPAKQFVTPQDKLRRALGTIRTELDGRLAELEAQGKLLESQRLKMRTEFDLEMMEEMGFCNGIENYSRHLSGRPPGSRPFTLLDFFPKDYLCVIDESHASIPQIGGMYAGDRSRKQVLVDYGFRLPSALDNRPLNFPEFMEMTNQILYMSATPGDFELRNSHVGNKTFLPSVRSDNRLTIEESADLLQRARDTFDTSSPGAPLVAEQIIRPTGLLDPKITVRPLKDQIDETIELCRQRIEEKQRVLVT